MKETNAKRKLIFYKNLGILNFRLFSTLFLIDIFITIPVIVVTGIYMIFEVDTMELYFSNKKILNGIYLKAET